MNNEHVHKSIENERGNDAGRRSKNKRKKKYARGFEKKICKYISQLIPKLDISNQ